MENPIITPHKLSTALHRAFDEINSLLDCPNEIIFNPEDPEPVILDSDLHKAIFKMGLISGFATTKQSLRQQFNIDQAEKLHDPIQTT